MHNMCIKAFDFPNYLVIFFTIVLEKKLENGEQLCDLCICDWKKKYKKKKSEKPL